MPTPYRLSLPGRMPRRFLVLFAIAVVTRLVFLLCMAGEVQFAEILTASTDATNYVQAARLIADSFSFDSTGVTTFGPGYPVFAALVATVFGHSLTVLFLFQILLSSLTPVLICLTTERLFANQRLGILAALLHVFSCTAVSLAGFPLSETLFVFLVSLSLWLWLRGLQSDRLSLLCWSMTLLALAALTRSLGLLLPVVWILGTFVTPRRRPGAYRRPFGATLGRLLVAILPFVVIAGAWMGRNAATFGTPQLAMASVTSGLRFACFARSQITETPYREILAEAAVEVTACKEAGGDHYPCVSQTTRDLLLDALINHPWRLATVYLKNVETNIHTTSRLLPVQLPTSHQPVTNFFRTLDTYALTRWRVVILVLIGVAMLWYRGQGRGAILPATLTLYFWFVGGISIWQTSRIAYPAEIAWAPLVAVPLLWGWDRLADITARRGQRT